MTIRVVQWATGVVGKPATRAIIKHPEMELVGCHCHSEEKVGADAGVLVGAEPIGVAATNDIDALLALQPDCVCYMPVKPDVDEIVRILEAGCNIVTTVLFITGTQLGADAKERIERAAQAKAVSVYATGVNPGLADVIALVASSGCSHIDKITVLESCDATAYDSADTWTAIGVGLPVDDPTAPARAEAAMPSFKETVEWLASALKIAVDEIRFDIEYAAATEDVDLGYMKIGKDCISGMRCTWSAQVGGRSLIELKVAWKLGTKLQPDWPVEEGWVVEIEGTPNIRCVYQNKTEEFDPATLTAMPAVHAIPHVCAARPGIITADELPLVTAAHCVG